MNDTKSTKRVIVMIKLIGPWASVFLSGGIAGYVVGCVL